MPALLTRIGDAVHDWGDDGATIDATRLYSPLVIDQHAGMPAIDVIRRRLKEDRVPDIPDEFGTKKKRPREVAFMDVNLCFPCGKCPEFCPVQCIEYLRPGSVPGRGVQPVQDRFQECIGCYICVEVCSLLTDYDAVRMYDVSLVEQALGVKVGDTAPAVPEPAEPWEDLFSEGGMYRHLGKGSRIRDKMNAEERAIMARERG
jgi:Pyruvate/2-oxoacid:ferredoxin oxidoreductase delta subunit